MTSIAAVSTYLPQSVPIAELQEKEGLGARQIMIFKRFYGLSSVCRDPERDEEGLLLAAAAKLDALRGQEMHVRYVVQARTVVNSRPQPADSLRRICRELGLEHAMAFSVSHHACASGLQAVDICGRLLAADGDPHALALLLTGEKTFTPAVRWVPRSNIASEGAAAVLLRAPGTSDSDRVLGQSIRVYGQFHAEFITGEASSKEFNDLYPEAVVEAMLSACESAEITLDDIDLVIPHNVNTMSWRRISELLGMPMERIFVDNIPLISHCLTADPFINYETAGRLGRLRPGARYLLVAAGLGATFSAMVVQH